MLIEEIVPVTLMSNPVHSNNIWPVFKELIDPKFIGNWFVTGSKASMPLFFWPVLFKVTSNRNGFLAILLFLFKDVNSNGMTSESNTDLSSFLLYLVLERYSCLFNENSFQLH